MQAARRTRQRTAAQRVQQGDDISITDDSDADVSISSDDAEEGVAVRAASRRGKVNSNTHATFTARASFLAGIKEQALFL